MSSKYLAILLAVAACADAEPTLEREVEMRSFLTQPSGTTTPLPVGPTADVEATAASSITCAADQPDCGCDIDDTYLAQIFLKDPRGPSNSIAGSLLLDGEILNAQALTLHPDTEIGIDVFTREPLTERGEVRTIDGETYHYVIMQDEPVFSDAHPFDPSTLESTVAYTFAMGASHRRPDLSPVGCLMTVVVDFRTANVELADEAHSP